MREHFDLDPGLIYLNSGSHSIVPRGVRQAWIREIEAYERNPTGNLFGAWARLWQVQKKLAAYLGAEAQDLFLRVNVTEALNEFVQGMPLPAGKAIGLSDLEYGAVTNLVRYRAERDGRPVRTIRLPATPEELDGLTPAKLLKLIEAQLSPDLGLLVVSDVMTGTGLLLPLRELAALTRARGILLAVDGAQGLGSRPIDFREFGDVDFYGGNLHKWFMAPKGTSFGWVHPRHQAALQPRLAGWTTYESTGLFAQVGN
jgi:isopenicillin-N epimerase